MNEIRQFDKYKDKIIGTSPLMQYTNYDYSKWKKWLEPINSLFVELEEVNNIFNGQISRNKLIEFANKCSELNSTQFSTRLFLACMIWGYGGETKKDNDDRGPYRVRKMFESEEETKAKIHKSFGLVVEENFKDAHAELEKIKGLSISFSSKFLYFSSRGCNKKDYPLIFDVRVAKSLIEITSTSEQLIEIVNISPSTKYKHYKRYNDFAHNIAKGFNCEAENVELFLFDYANKKI